MAAGAGADTAAGGGVIDAIRSVSGSASAGRNYGSVLATDRAGAWEKSQDLAAEASRRKRLRIIFVVLGFSLTYLRMHRRWCRRWYHVVTEKFIFWWVIVKKWPIGRDGP